MTMGNIGDEPSPRQKPGSRTEVELRIRYQVATILRPLIITKKNGWGGDKMQLKKSSISIWGLVFFVLISLHSSLIYSAEGIPPGSVLPEFKIVGSDSPQTKAYLGINNEKLFSLSQIKTKLVLVEFFDVF
jgi:hypothetical protein